MQTVPRYAETGLSRRTVYWTYSLCERLINQIIGDRLLIGTPSELLFPRRCGAVHEMLKTTHRESFYRGLDVKLAARS